MRDLVKFFLFVKLLIVHQTAAVNLASRVCRLCKKIYDPSLNGPRACRHHRGRWIGAENSKHAGTRSGGENRGLSVFWDCCGEEDPTGPGCITGFHKSYDEDENYVFINLPKPPER